MSDAQDPTDPRSAAPGQEPGHAGFDWADLVDGLVAERGSLAAVALHLAESRAFAEDVESAERGLRRLRKRTADGGVWGERVLRCFGLPRAVTDRVRWMGQYHTRFTDLPASLCAELLGPWDRPPITQSPARIWILLGRVSLAIRARRDPSALLHQARLLAARADDAARAELGLVDAYAVSRVDAAAADEAIARVGRIVRDPDAVLTAADRACLFARYVDQRAYRLNKPRVGPADHPAALALYEEIPADGPLFARCRRENGLGWSKLRMGDRVAAEAHARSSVRAAGDAGSLRMRAMALNLLARATSDPESTEARARSLAIARRLEDEALTVRFRRRP